MSGPVWKLPDRREHPERLCNYALGVCELANVIVDQSTPRKDLIDFLLQSFLRSGKSSEQVTNPAHERRRGFDSGKQEVHDDIVNYIVRQLLSGFAVTGELECRQQVAVVDAPLTRLQDDGVNNPMKL